MKGFDADNLIDCYRAGVFPMAETRDDPRIMIVEPSTRGVMIPARIHLSARLARQVRQDPFEMRIDTAFDSVVEACALPRAGRPDSWINAPIQTLYGELFRRGQAHSVECWRDGKLVGGLYGVSLGGAFFGESMFSNATNASKIALAHLAARLIVGGYSLLDCQFQTPHLAQFGAIEMPQESYLMLLKDALPLQADFFAAPTDMKGQAALQAISQAS